MNNPIIDTIWQLSLILIGITILLIIIKIIQISIIPIGM
jgi:hypothetical protein